MSGKAVGPHAQRVACREIIRRRGAYAGLVIAESEREFPLDEDQRLSDREARLCVQGKRTQMARRLHKPYLLNAASTGLLQGGLHQPPPDASFGGRKHGERSDGRGWSVRERIEKDAPENVAVVLCENPEGLGIADFSLEQSDRKLHRWVFRREIVRGRDGLVGFVRDDPALRRVG